MNLDLRIDSITLWSVEELTRWRNAILPDEGSMIFRKISAEFGYLGLVVVGVVEAIARFIFAGIAFVIHPCFDEEGRKEIWSNITSLLIGNGFLSFSGAISSLALVFLNPCKSVIEENDMHICYENYLP